MNNHSAAHISPSALLESIKGGNAPVIVDVRSRPEFDRGHIRGAIHMPFWSAFIRSRKLGADRQGPVVLYCQHGPRAGLAGIGFRLAGFRSIQYLEGHMSAWEKAGLPLES
jgi:hydroxyacylglutathione hydrolase